MMNSFFVALNAVLPMFIMIISGYVVRRLNIIKESFLSPLNKLVFNAFFPVMMFYNIYSSDFGNSFSGSLLIYAVVAVLVIYFLSFGVTMIVEKSNYSRGAMIQAIYRSNFVLMGLPTVANIFGKDKLGMTAVLVTVIVPLYNVLAVITLEIFRGNSVKPIKILKGIAKNPLIIGSVIGVLAVLLRIKLPYALETAVSDIGSAATPIALIALGASFSFVSIKRCKRNLIICVVSRLIVVPSLCLSVAILLGFRGIELVSLVGIFCSPCAISSFTMSQQMESDYELSGNTIVFTSLFASMTMFLWLYMFSLFGLY